MAERVHDDPGCRGDIVGTVLLFAQKRGVYGWERHEHCARVENIVVDSSCRREGIGHALLKLGMEWAKESGHTACEATVNTGNEASNALFQKAEFAHINNHFWRPLPL